MSTERFDIEVQDRVAKSIRTELAAIGASARDAHRALTGVRSELAGLSGVTGAVSGATAGIREQTRASNDNARAAKAEAAAIRQVTNALEEQARAARNAASARGSVGTAPPRAAASAPPRSGGAGIGGGVESSAAAVAVGARAASREIGNMGRSSAATAQHMMNLSYQLNDVAVSLASGQKPMMVFMQQGAQIFQISQQAGGGIRGLATEALTFIGVLKKTSNAELDLIASIAAQEAASLQAAATTAAANVAAAETETALALAQREAATTATEAAAAEARLALADTAVAEAAAEAAIAQQALAGAQARAGAAGAAAAAETAVGLTAMGAAAVVAAVAVVGGLVGIKVAQDSINDSVSKEQLTKGLGLTAKEMKKLEDVTVTYGDTAKAVFQVIGNAIWDKVGGTVKDVWEVNKAAFLDMMGIIKDWANFLIGAAVGSYNALIKTFTKLPDAMADLFLTAVNMAIDAINSLVKAAVDGINSFLATAENAVGIDLFGTLSAPQIDKVKNDYAGAAKEVGDTWASEISKATKRDYLGELGAAVKDQAAKNAQGRLGKQAKDIIDNRAEHKAAKGRKAGKSDEEKRAEALDKVNRDLDAQIKLSGFYGDALQTESKFQAINNALLDKHIQLTAGEEKAIRDKLAAIQDNTRVQDALNAIYKDAVEPSKIYAATIKAIDQALQDNIITEEEANRRRTIAQNNLAHDSNPLFDYTQEISRAEHNMALYGRQLDVATRAQELFDKAVAAGQVNRDDNGAKKDFEQQAKDEQRKGDINDAFAAIDPREKTADTNSFILDNYRDMYAQLDELRQNDLISEEEAQERKKNLDKALGDARLDAASSVFGNLATLQDSHVKEVAAIGKAAAIAQATIDGYRAVQAALAGPPGPPWSYAIAASTAVMTAANVARIAGVGFMSGGYTGNGGTTEVAGAVHGQEYVFDAAATRRIGVPALEAMRSGRLGGAPSNDNRAPANIRVVQGPGTYTEVTERSDGEIEVIAERVARRVAPGAVASDMQNPNSKTSKSVQHNFGLKRNR